MQLINSQRTRPYALETLGKGIQDMIKDLHADDDISSGGAKSIKFKLPTPDAGIHPIEGRPGRQPTRGELTHLRLDVYRQFAKMIDSENSRRRIFNHPLLQTAKEKDLWCLSNDGIKALQSLVDRETFSKYR